MSSTIKKLAAVKTLDSTNATERGTYKKKKRGTYNIVSTVESREKRVESRETLIYDLPPHLITGIIVPVMRNRKFTVRRYRAY